ncbi:RHS repeat-associated core domain-containing protein [Xanthomonas nasturtii]|uniref:RHS repeat-associated core domain-containing protein n=1 Tax=Xanthomonas nasturtii TaxID=1843581 RepID=UPI002B22DD3D|nr:RHS repeat-associated core domain-containing protein [Xanthomonas nasturtii]MEA9579783.1 RHS repeat-associated core domain-containing protein [Xanthomonas nasturtii]
MKTSLVPILRTAILLAALAALPSLAVEPGKQKWTLEAQNASMPRQAIGTFDTQPKAVARIAQIPGPDEFLADIYKSVNQIKSISVRGSTMTITYWVGKSQSLDPEWMYVGQFTTESQALEWAKTTYTSGSTVCVAPTVSPVSDWEPSAPGFEGMLESRKYRMSASIIAGSECMPLTLEINIPRSKNMMCPVQGTQWSKKYQACVNEDVLAFVSGPAAKCDSATDGGSFQGNPCDVKTGEKTQPEQDIDLGWVTLTRTYHSLASVNTDGFGNGWSHSHQLRLTAEGSYITVVNGAGFQQAFRQDGSGFAAEDSSGDRIIQVDTGWRLMRRDAVQAFNAMGQLSRTDEQTGDWLSYRYDVQGRLVRIEGVQQRALEFVYGSGADAGLISSIRTGSQVLASYAYTTLKQIKTVTYPGAATRIYHYEDKAFPHYLTGVTAEDGRRFSWFAYDAQGRVASSRHYDGAGGISLTYSASGTTVVDALGKETLFGIALDANESAKVNFVTDAAGTQSNTFVAEPSEFKGRLATTLDRKGALSSHTYKSVQGQGGIEFQHVSQEAAGTPQVRTTTSRRLLANNRLVRADSDNQSERYEYNTRLQLVRVSKIDVATAQERSVNYAYCEPSDAVAGSVCPLTGLLKSVDGPRTDIDDRTTYNYYPIDAAGCQTGTGPCPYRKGDLKQTINARGQIRENLSYDVAGRVLSAVDENGVLTDYSYHPRGWLASTTVHGATAAQNRVTTFEYWPTGLVKRITQPDGSYATFVYDQAQRLTDVTDTLGNTLHYVLDKAGNRLDEQTKDAQGVLKRSLTRIYNQLGQLETQADAAANPTDYAYDANGNLRLITDAFGRSTLQEHDPLGRLARTLQDVDGIEAETNVGYDTQDRPLQVKDPKRLDTRYTYNGFGDTLKLTSPDTGVTSYTYDSAGNRATQTDARGVTSTYAYDALNRVLSISYPTAAFNVSYTYDVTQSVCASGETFTVGRLTKLQDGGGTTQYCYNRFGEVVRKVQVVNGKTFVLRYDYTTGGRLRSMVYPDGTTVDYVRNAQGQTTDVGVTAPGGSRQRLLGNATYYPFGQSSGWTYGNGRKLTRMYDLDYRPRSIQDTRAGGLEIGFGFDAVGDLTALTPAGNPTPELRLDYDALGRLKALKDGAANTVIDGYSYDATGNRLSAKVGGATQAYTYPTTNHRLSAVAGVARTYDKMGNTLTIGGKAREYLYDTTGRMTQVKRAGAAVMNYRYNGRGEQVRRYLGTTNTYTLYDEAGHWLGDYDTNGAPKQQAIWLDDLPVGLLANGGQLHYIEPDHLGSPRVVVDAARDVAVWNWSLKGEAFGNTAPNQDPDGDGAAMVFDMRFPGQRFDAASGFNQNYFRDYDAATGRYGQSDPIGLKGGVNSYSYANGRPFLSLDPFGLRPPLDQESSFVSSLFGGGFDTASLDIQQTSGSRASSLRGSNVKLPRSLFIDGDINKGIDLNKSEARSTLAHEVFHVWQRRRGAKVTSRLILPQVGYTLGLGSPYDYASPSNAEQASQYFNALFGAGKYEAQAQLWEDSYIASDSTSLAGEIWNALQSEVQNGCLGQ